MGQTAEPIFCIDAEPYENSNRADQGELFVQVRALHQELPGLLKYKCYIISAKSGSSAISQSSIQRFPSTGLLQMPYR
jgi:hypothetical protein